MQWEMSDNKRGLHIELGPDLHSDQYRLSIRQLLPDGTIAYANDFIEGLAVVQAKDPDEVLRTWALHVISKYCGEFWAGYIAQHVMVSPPPGKAMMSQVIIQPSTGLGLPTITTYNMTNTSTVNTTNTFGALVHEKNHPGDTVLKLWPQLAKHEATCPVCFASTALYGLVQHVNDEHRWSREAIADWLDTLDIDLSAEGVIVDADGNAVRVATAADDG